MPGLYLVRVSPYVQNHHREAGRLAADAVWFAGWLQKRTPAADEGLQRVGVPQSVRRPEVCVILLGQVQSMLQTRLYFGHGANNNDELSENERILPIPQSARGCKTTISQGCSSSQRGEMSPL